MISLIVACDRNSAIGFDNQLLCTLKDDMKHFKDITMRNVVVMGRKTYESIGEELPNRFNVVLTRNKMYSDDVWNPVIYTFEDVLKANEMNPSLQIFIIGGQTLYEQFLPYASRIYMTKISHAFENADTYFPQLDDTKWKVVDERYFEQNERNEYSFMINTLERTN